MAIHLNETKALYEPSPLQAEFHALKVDEALFGGAAGSGKSGALIADPVQCGLLIQEHERWKRGEIKSSKAVCLYLRKTVDRHDDSVKKALELYTATDPGFTLTNHKSFYKGTFSCGMEIFWGHLANDDSYMAHRSKEYTRIYWDELATDFVDEAGHAQYEQMQSRIRTPDPMLRPFLASRAASNPWPNWVRDYFVTPAPNGFEVLERAVTLSSNKVVRKTRIFIRAFLKDHPDPAFREDYEGRLRMLPKHIQAAQLGGDWYSVAGSFFADVWDADIVVINPFKIPPHWKRGRALDWGMKHEAVVLWYAITPDGEMVVYRERTFNGKKAAAEGKTLNAKQVALRIKDIEIANGEWDFKRGCSKLTGPADTQLWENRGKDDPGQTMASDMAGVGVFWKKATKGRVQAAQQVYKRLSERSPRTGFPGLMIFRTCQGIIQTVPSLQVDDSEPEAPKGGGPDHWYDCLSYACVEYTPPSKEFAPTRSDDEDDEDKFTDDLAARRGAFGGGIR